MSCPRKPKDEMLAFAFDELISKSSRAEMGGLLTNVPDGSKWQVWKA